MSEWIQADITNELDVLLSSIPEFTDLDDMELDFDNVVTTDTATTTADEWVTLEFSVPKDAEHVIENEIQRIARISEFQPDVPERVRRGLILERICANSGLTPIKSLI